MTLEIRPQLDAQSTVWPTVQARLATLRSQIEYEGGACGHVGGFNVHRILEGELLHVT